jgi:hypothetical protein
MEPEVEDTELVGALLLESVGNSLMPEEDSTGKNWLADEEGITTVRLTLLSGRVEVVVCTLVEVMVTIPSDELKVASVDELDGITGETSVLLNPMLEGGKPPLGGTLIVAVDSCTLPVVDVIPELPVATELDFQP